MVNAEFEIIIILQLNPYHTKKYIFLYLLPLLNCDQKFAINRYKINLYLISLISLILIFNIQNLIQRFLNLILRIRNLIQSNQNCSYLNHHEIHHPNLFNQPVIYHILDFLHLIFHLVILNKPFFMFDNHNKEQNKFP